MSEWFQQRYIRRGEHQEIVGYYRKLVARLHVEARGLREQLEAIGAAADGKQDMRAESPQKRARPVPIAVAEPEEHPEEPGTKALRDRSADANDGWRELGPNVVRLDVYRLRRGIDIAF